jgi:hypothetical protein
MVGHETGVSPNTVEEPTNPNFSISAENGTTFYPRRVGNGYFNPDDTDRAILLSLYNTLEIARSAPTSEEQERTQIEFAVANSLAFEALEKKYNDRKTKSKNANPHTETKSREVNIENKGDNGTEDEVYQSGRQKSMSFYKVWEDAVQDGNAKAYITTPSLPKEEYVQPLKFSTIVTVILTSSETFSGW